MCAYECMTELKNLATMATAFAPACSVKGPINTLSENKETWLPGVLPFDGNQASKLVVWRKKTVPFFEETTQISQSRLQGGHRKGGRACRPRFFIPPFFQVCEQILENCLPPSKRVDKMCPSQFHCCLGEGLHYGLTYLPFCRKMNWFLWKGKYFQILYVFVLT